MTVNISKCHPFGIREKGTSSIQFKRKLYVNNILIPPVEIDKYFAHNNQQTNNQHKEEIVTTTNEVLSEIDRLPLHKKRKENNISKGRYVT